jgi:hypothetical protein
MLRKWIPFFLVGLCPVSALAAAPNLPAICEKNVAKADPRWKDYSGSTNFEAMDGSKTRRKKWLSEAPREQFVTTKADVKSSFSGGVVHPGEPLLLVDCRTEYTQFVDVVLISLDYKVVTPKPDQVDFTPKSFKLPEPPKPPEFTEILAYNRAIPADYEAVKGSHLLVEKRGKCEDSGIGAAQASEKKVKDGPNHEQRRKDAGADAHATAFAKCYTPKMQAEYAANAKKLFELENARDAAAFDELMKKFK